jgi:hypothetical protein
MHEIMVAKTQEGGAVANPAALCPVVAAERVSPEPQWCCCMYPMMSNLLFSLFVGLQNSALPAAGPDGIGSDPLAAAAATAAAAEKGASK